MANESVRLVAWNCAGGFHRKSKVLDAHAPDIVVLSEASKDCVSLIGGEASGAWIGSHPGYGLAVLGMNGWKIETIETAVEESLFLPVRAVRGSEQLYLVGLCAKKDGDYVAPTLRALTRLSAFISEKGAILAGDFNQSVKFDAREVLPDISGGCWMSLKASALSARGIIPATRNSVRRHRPATSIAGNKDMAPTSITHLCREDSRFRQQGWVLTMPLSRPD
ncbi:hypothetical protein [Mesorhizobium sp.]|uniref:endonuclease/exonuclease/phosphatase family protein n=1 Tax=Mesorhizobium sp. TaxID=1871066 RepID=UPI000FE98D67|nr:hypothetical protein [Mesorhizobium sp.]RWO26480.1 MAG: endonuclease/exonuclease/phosphatase family protein [Mesorhizobium sp.]